MVKQLLWVWIAVSILIIISMFSPLPDSKWQLKEVTGHLPDVHFSLTDDHNQTVTEKTYRGDTLLLYFGFTGCAAQCPLTMARTAELMQALGADAKNVRLLFVTVNPTNDTPELLHRYIAGFDSNHMVGLTGSEREIEALAKSLRAAYRADNNNAHSNAIYIFDAQGHARLLATPEDDDVKIIHDIRQLL